ncbi:MAG: hypothetical protein HDS57_01105 [Barnesiella sp.]|nr:hypothetical protein [Barnesiella sp.]
MKLRTSILLPSRPTDEEHIGHKTRTTPHHTTPHHTTPHHTTPHHTAAAIEANSSRCGQL